jgi:hypothetical protein
MYQDTKGLLDGLSALGLMRAQTCSFIPVPDFIYFAVALDYLLPSDLKLNEMFSWLACCCFT